MQRIVASRIPGSDDAPARVLTHAQAALVADLADGSMRSVMTLLRELFEISDGFIGKLSLDQITARAESVKRRPSPEAALLAGA